MSQLLLLSKALHIDVNMLYIAGEIDKRAKNIATEWTKRLMRVALKKTVLFTIHRASWHIMFGKLSQIHLHIVSVGEDAFLHQETIRHMLRHMLRPIVHLSLSQLLITIVIVLCADPMLPNIMLPRTNDLQDTSATFAPASPVQKCSIFRGYDSQ